MTKINGKYDFLTRHSTEAKYVKILQSLPIFQGKSDKNIKIVIFEGGRLFKRFYMIFIQNYLKIAESVKIL